MSEKIKNSFIPELWSEELIEIFKKDTRRTSRSYGSRLLRAAAKGEDWTKIQRKETYDEIFTDDAADALAYAIDNNVLNILRNRK